MRGGYPFTEDIEKRDKTRWRTHLVLSTIGFVVGMMLILPIHSPFFRAVVSPGSVWELIYFLVVVITLTVSMVFYSRASKALEKYELHREITEDS